MKYKISKYLDMSASHVKIYDMLSFTEQNNKTPTWI